MALKNASITITFAAWNVSASPAALKSGDAANITCQISKDGGAFAACTNSPSELGSTGIYKLVLTADERNCSTVRVLSTSTTASVLCEPFFEVTEDLLNATLPGSYPVSSAGYYISLLGSTEATIPTNIQANTNKLTIVAGDDYNYTDGTHLTFTFNTATPTLAGATLYFKVEKKDTTGLVLTKTMTVSSSGGATQTAYLELDSANTTALYNQSLVFDIQAVLATGRTYTLVSRAVLVVKDAVR